VFVRYAVKREMFMKKMLGKMPNFLTRLTSGCYITLAVYTRIKTPLKTVIQNEVITFITSIIIHWVFFVDNTTFEITDIRW